MSENEPHKEIPIGALVLKFLDQALKPISLSILLGFINEYYEEEGFPPKTVRQLSEAVERQIDDGYVGKKYDLSDNGLLKYSITGAKGITNSDAKVQKAIDEWRKKEELG